MHPRSMVALSLVAVALAGLLIVAGEGQAAGQNARITKLVGQVTHRVGATGQFVASSVGSQLPAGSRVRTGAGGRAQIAFPNGAVFRMSERTDLVIQAASRSQVSRGQIYARIVAGTAVQVGGATATAAVRGTTLELTVGDDDTTVLTVASGEVEFFNELGSVTVLAAQQSTARPGEAPSRPIAVDPSSLQAWEAGLQNLIIELEAPPQVDTDPGRLEQELLRRQGVLDQRPDDAAANADVARVLMDLGRAEEALAAAERAAELAPEAAEYQGLLGYARLQAGQLDAAAESFGTAAAAEADNVQWALGQGLVALARGQDQEAAQLLQGAAQMAPDDPLPQAYLAAAWMRLGDLEAADAAAASAVQLGPEQYLGYGYLSYARLVAGKVDEARMAAATATRLAPASALAHDALGTAYFFGGDFDGARTELDRALELAPLSARAHLTLAKLMAAEGDLPEALDQAQVAVGLNPDSAPARSTLGLLMLLNNDPWSAGEQFELALTLDANLAEARTGWAQVLARRGQFREALSQQKAALALDTDSASIENNLGGVFAAQGEMAVATEHLQQAIELQPGWGMPYANLALVYLEENRYAEALEMGERAVELGERSPFVHTVLARIYARQGRTDRALFELRHAVALDEDYPQAHYQLAQLYLEQDRARDAVREILGALTHDPSAMLETRLYARTEVTASAASNPTLHLDAQHSGQGSDGHLSYFASGMIEDSDGFRDANQDHAESFVEVIAGHQAGPDRQLVFYGTWYDADAGLPGSLPGDLDDGQDLSGFDALLAWRQRLSPDVTATLKYSYRDTQFTFRNPGSLQGADDNPFRRLDSGQTQHTPEIRLEADLTDHCVLRAGYAHQWGDRDRSGQVGVVDPDTAQVVFQPFTTATSPDAETAWVEVQGDVSDRLSLLAGARWGQEEGSPEVALPKVVALYRPDQTSWLSFTVEPIFRTDIADLAPVEPLADPYGLRYLSFTEGGAARSYALRYQRSAGPGGTLTTALAYQTVDGLMIDVEDPGLTGLPSRVLIDDGRRWVADVAYEQWLGDKVTGRVWARWQDSEGDSPEVQIANMAWPYAPEWQFGGRLDYVDDSGWRVGLDCIWVGDRFHDPANTQTVSSYHLVNLRAQYQRNLHENYFVGIRNLTDESYQTYLGFPQSGVTVYGGVEYRH